MFYNPKLEGFTQIIDLFREDNPDITYHINLGRLFIDSPDGETDFMLRFDAVSKVIRVARIQFKHQRQGYGVRLLDLLDSYGLENGFSVLTFESVMTNEAYQFLKKNGFRRDEQHAIEPHPFAGDWQRVITREDIQVKA